MNTVKSDNRARTKIIRRRKVTHDNDNVIIVKNFDKDAINQLLEDKEMKVGEVVLVNGKPAIIKKRKMVSDINLASDSDMSPQRLRLPAVRIRKPSSSDTGIRFRRRKVQRLPKNVVRKRRLHNFYAI